MRILHVSVVNIHKMELAKFEIRVLLKHYWKQDYKAAAATRRICEVEVEGVISEPMAEVASNVSTLEKKILQINHVLEYLNYGIMRIYAEFWKRIHKKVLYVCIFEDLGRVNISGHWRT